MPSGGFLFLGDHMEEQISTDVSIFVKESQESKIAKLQKEIESMRFTIQTMLDELATLRSDVRYLESRIQ